MAEENVIASTGEPVEVENQVTPEPVTAETEQPTPAVEAPTEAVAETEPITESEPVSEPVPAPTPVVTRELSDQLRSTYSAETDTNRREVVGGRSYEIIYIVRPGDQPAVEASTTRLRSMIEEPGGAVDNIRVSDTARLAYPVRKQTEGVYVVVNARMQQTATTEIDRYLKLDEAVLRHLILRDE